MRVAAICMGCTIAFGALQGTAAVEPTQQEERALAQELKQKRQLLEKLSAHIKKLEQQLEKMQPGKGPAMRVVAYKVADVVAAPESGKGDDINFDPLILFITKHVAPEHWKSMGGPGTVAVHRANSALVISASTEVHEQVSDQLTAIREAKKLLDELGGVKPKDAAGF